MGIALLVELDFALLHSGSSPGTRHVPLAFLEQLGQVVEVRRDVRVVPAEALLVDRHRASAEHSRELVDGARGGSVSGVRVHSLRLEGILSSQEVAFANEGEQFSLLHQSTSYGSFVKGALAAIRYVTATTGVAVGLDAALGI